MISKRVFLALPIDPAEQAVAKMEQLKNLLHDYKIKWVPPENLHITLFFFGEITINQIRELRKLLNNVTIKFPSFSFFLISPGIFSKGREPKVLWIGIKAPDLLFELKKEVDKSVADFGFIPDAKTFRPHLTLGRFVPQQELSDDLVSILHELQLKEPKELYVSRLILFESKLSAADPRYIPIDIFSLLQ